MERPRGMVSAWTGKMRRLRLILIVGIAAVTLAKASDPPAFVWHAPALSRMDTVFIIAATGEPRFKARRDSCEKLLLAGDSLTLDYLIARRLIGQTPRQRHYVEHLFVAM